MKKTYLLTVDVEPLLQYWAQKNGFSIPDTEFFSTIHTRLIHALKIALGDGTYVKWFPIEIICSGVQNLVSEHASHLPLVIMDKMFRNITNSHPVFYYESSRVMHHTTEGYKLMGEGPRPGCLPLDQQAKQIADALGATPENPKSIALIDDGCFSGDSLQHCMKMLAATGVQIRCVFIGILKQSKSVQSIQIPIYAHLTFGDELLDWLCERDLLVGIPEGGRVLDGSNPLSGIAAEIAVPYLSGFGDPCDWASIPEHAAKPFSDLAIRLSLEIFSEIEKISQKTISFGDIARWPFYPTKPLEWSKDDHFTQGIERVLLH